MVAGEKEVSSEEEPMEVVMVVEGDPKAHEEAAVTTPGGRLRREGDGGEEGVRWDGGTREVAEDGGGGGAGNGEPQDMESMEEEQEEEHEEERSDVEALSAGGALAGDGGTVRG